MTRVNFRAGYTCTGIDWLAFAVKVSNGEGCPAKVGLQEEVGLGVGTVKGEGVHWDG